MKATLANVMVALGATVVLASCRETEEPLGPRLTMPVLQGGEAEQAGVLVTIAHNATVLKHGQQLLVRGRVACHPVEGIAQPTEAFIILAQESPAASGEGFFQAIECDGKSRHYHVRVEALDGFFHRGTAHASAFVLVCDQDIEDCEAGQDSRNVRVRGSRRTGS